MKLWKISYAAWFIIQLHISKSAASLQHSFFFFLMQILNFKKW